jgi:hypothetical protein
MTSENFAAPSILAGSQVTRFRGSELPESRLYSKFKFGEVRRGELAAIPVFREVYSKRIWDWLVDMSYRLGVRHSKVGMRSVTRVPRPS